MVTTQDRCSTEMAKQRLSTYLVQERQTCSPTAEFKSVLESRKSLVTHHLLSFVVLYCVEFLEDNPRNDEVRPAKTWHK